MVDLHRQYLDIRDEVDRAIGDVIAETAFIKGPAVGLFEEELARRLEVRHCIACGNGTDALLLSLLAVGLQRGDEVIVPAFAFAAVTETVLLLGGVPVFADVDPRTFNIDPASVARLVSERTRVVIPVHLFGQPCDMAALTAVAKEHGLKVIEDNAQSLGAVCRMSDGASRYAGTIGEIGCTSFFPSKVLGCYGDGGAVFTDHDEWAAALRSLRVHGKSPTDKYDNVRIGLNSRLDTIQAAVLQVKLEAFEEYELQQVNNAAAQYTERLRDIVQTPVVKNGFYSSWAQYSILLEEEKIRDGLKGHLASKGIPAMIFYPKPLHAQRAFGDIEYSGHCPVADDICKRILSLPIHPYLAEDAIESVAQTIKKYLDRKNI